MGGIMTRFTLITSRFFGLTNLDDGILSVAIIRPLRNGISVWYQLTQEVHHALTSKRVRIVSEEETESKTLRHTGIGLHEPVLVCKPFVMTVFYTQSPNVSYEPSGTRCSCLKHTCVSQKLMLRQSNVRTYCGLRQGRNLTSYSG